MMNDVKPGGLFPRIALGSDVQLREQGQGGQGAGVVEAARVGAADGGIHDGEALAQGEDPEVGNGRDFAGA